MYTYIYCQLLPHIYILHIYVISVLLPNKEKLNDFFERIALGHLYPPQRPTVASMILLGTPNLTSNQVHPGSMESFCYEKT